MIDRARESAEKYGVAKYLTPDELFKDDETELIVNLTVPQAHYELTMKAIESGKHVYTEKPFALTREEALNIIEAAAKKGVREIGRAHV